MHNIKTSIYTYCVLQYRHSQVLEECLNVGLLVYFPEYKQLHFLFPKKLGRITTVYPEVQERTIKLYLHSFADKVNYLNRSADIFANGIMDTSFVKFISENLLPPDSSSLQFSDPKRGLMRTNDLSQKEDIAMVSEKLYKQYFYAYDSAIVDNNKRDEHYIISTYKRFLKEKENERGEQFKAIYYDVEISPTEGELFKFDICWQNGTKNLVKPVSFDLTKPEHVQNKALKFFGQFKHLESYAEENNIMFDILLAKPKRKELFKNYNNAIKLLEEPKRVRLIAEEEIYKYSEKTAETIKT